MMDGALSQAREPPATRTDLDAALKDLDEGGMAIMAGAFPDAEIDEARATVMRLAASELEEGCASLSFGTQRVWGLIHKAPIFRKIATHPQVLALAHHILGPRMMIYSMQAHIVPTGGGFYPHFDQSDHKPMPPFPVVAAVVIMLEAFTAENGATVVALGRFARSNDETPPAVEEMTPITGGKGTMSAYGGLLWHSTGVNRTATPRVGILIHYCMPWIRQHENYQRVISPSVAQGMTPQMRDLLGIHEQPFGRRWHAIGPEYAERSTSHGE
jgi:hypothetical protein